MRHIASVLLLVFGSLTWLSGCKKDAKPIVPEGIIYSPIKPYQEALPGSIINFKVRVRSAETVTSFGVRFKFPDATDYVSLPQYPDLTQTAEFTGENGVFEYALPAASVSINADMKFKFVAATANKTYESEYTVRMKTTGGQAVRLYGPIGYAYTKFGAIDLLNAAGIAQAAPDLTRDVTSLILNFPYLGKNYELITGFTSANGTKFKLSSLADYNLAPAQYAARYAAIAVANEFNSLAVTGADETLRRGNLLGNTYYIAKVNRNNVFSYVGIAVRKIPAATLLTSGPVPVQLPGNEVLDLEIKK